jgi:hypothetical protein
VGVDDPRHEGGARRVEHPGLPVAGDVGPGPDGGDRGILDHHDRVFQRVSSPAVDERGTGDGEASAHVRPLDPPDL